MRDRALAAPARAATVRCAQGLAGRGRAALARNAPAARSTSRRCAAPRSRTAQLWWGGAVAFYEHGFDRLTTTDLRARAQRRRARATSSRRSQRDADRFGARDELDRLIYQDLRLRLPELLLMRVDKLTMANAVEARVPFLDHELVELAMAIPRDEKIRDGVGKHVLKRAVADLLPARPGLAAQAGLRHAGVASGSGASSAISSRRRLDELGDQRARLCSTAARSASCSSCTAADAPTGRSSSGTCSTSPSGSTTGSPATRWWLAGPRSRDSALQLKP